MMNFKIEKVVIFYTNICNFKCSHCFVSPLFNEKEIMSDEIFNKTIDMVLSNKISKISISGGEPMLFWDKFKTNLKRASDNNVYCSICTNAYWSKSDKEMKNIIKDLKEHGIKRLEISTDSYHQQFVGLKDIINCIKEAQDNGIEIITTICFKELYEEAYTINAIRKTINNYRNMRLKVVSNYGEAKKGNLNPKQDIHIFEKYRCNQIGQPVIMYNGDVYACCGPAFTLNEKSLYLANILYDKEECIFKNIYSNKKIMQLKNNKLTSLIPNYKEIIDKENINSVCELCLYFMKNNISF